MADERNEFVQFSEIKQAIAEEKKRLFSIERKLDAISDVQQFMLAKQTEQTAMIQQILSIVQAPPAAKLVLTLGKPVPQ
jgi:fructose-specific component phosphotransferase system IIB-like protein